MPARTVVPASPPFDGTALVLVPPGPVQGNPELPLAPPAPTGGWPVRTVASSMPIRGRPALAVVPSRPVGTGGPTWALGRVRWAVPPGPGTRHRGPWGRLRLAGGPTPTGSVGTPRLGLSRSRARGPKRPSRSSRERLGPRRRVGGRSADDDGFLPRRPPLHGDDHTAVAAVRRLGGWRVAWRRRGRGGTGTAGGPLRRFLLRRLDLDGAERAQVRDRRVQSPRGRSTERLDQQLAAGDHRRGRGRRERRHRQGDDHRCVAARRHARRSPAA
jgi:hypothetical protein